MDFDNSMLRNHPNLFTDHQLKYPINNLNLPFSEYISTCKKIIANTRVDLQNNAEKIIEANAPFELFPTEKNPKVGGALLIHGLLDCPLVMRDVGKQLQKNGLLARAILLPGQGTTPGDLLNVTMETWVQTIRYGVATLTKEVEKIYLVGFSTGAALALYSVLANKLENANIAGLILMSPAIKIRSHLDFTTSWFSSLGKIWQRASWLHIAKEDDYARYQSIPFNAGYQVYRLTRAIKKLSRKKNPPCPMQFILSLADTTVSAKASIKYFQKHLAPHNQLLLYSSKTSHQYDPNTIVRNSVFPELRIKRFSHICIPISPTNSHYGKNGDYHHASRVDQPEDITYGALNRFEMMLYHFLLKTQIIIEQHQRLTFNPDFDFMMKEILAFTNAQPHVIT